MKLHPPDPDWWQYRIPRLPPPPKPWYALVLDRTIPYFANWLDAKGNVLFPPSPGTDPALIAQATRLSRRPGYEALLDGWRLTTTDAVNLMFRRKDLPPVFEDALDFTAFALDQFKERTDRDGASLVILSTHRMGMFRPAFDRLRAMAESRGIPVIDQYDYILRHGAEPEDAQWAHDAHWNAAGHRWAAEALLEYLKRNRDVCDGPIGTAEPDPATKRPSR